ncbi:MAG: NAD(P)-dependent oxidoreductase [Gemmataceae bacterium]
MIRALIVSLSLAAWASAEPLKLKFDEVREVAPGVFFRYSAISPTDPSVFGGSNNIWVVFDEYVAVIDANFPKEAADVIAAIRKTTKKPIRYVLDTHHHGDHAWGNDVWIREGATVVASRKAAKLLRDTGPDDFAKAGKGPGARKDVAAGKLGFPSLIFDDKLVLDDGTQRVEFMQLGHSHTIGDAVAYLPKHKILCTGDACVNGPYNYMGHSDSADWVRCLERMEALDVRMVLPGHGVPMGKELLANQKRYFVELRRQVKKAIDEGKALDDVQRAIDLPWYKEWTTVKPAADNVKHVYGEFTGLVAPWELEQSLGILAGPSPTKDTPGWVKPKKVVVPAGLTAQELGALKRAAPEVEFVPAKTPEQAAALAADADGVLGFATAGVFAAGKRLRWVQASPDGIDDAAWKARGAVTVTDARRVNAPAVAEQSMALLLTLARKVAGAGAAGELAGKRLLLVGLGGTGEQIAKRAAAFGLRVTALDDAAAERPAGVERLERTAKLDELLPSADVVVLAVPLTAATRGLIGAERLGMMKKGAMLINAAHTPLIDQDALAKSGVAVGLDVGDVPFRKHLVRGADKAHQVIVSTAPTAETGGRLWALYRENVRRFAAGEPLLSVAER